MFVDKYLMHSFFNWLNTLFAFTLTILIVLTIGVFVSTYFEHYYGNSLVSANEFIV